VPYPEDGCNGALEHPRVDIDQCFFPRRRLLSIMLLSKFPLSSVTDKQKSEKTKQTESQRLFDTKLLNRVVM
jgi:hypothetical protein